MNPSPALRADGPHHRWQVAQLLAAQPAQAEPPTCLLSVPLRLRPENVDITRSVLWPPHLLHAGCFCRCDRLVMISKVSAQSAHLYS